jgi:hypothetical protein
MSVIFYRDNFKLVDTKGDNDLGKKYGVLNIEANVYVFLSDDYTLCLEYINSFTYLK